MDLKSYFFESADLGEDARVQLLQDKYGLGSEEEARALESSLMSTIEGSGLERERAFLSPQQLRRQRQLRADVRERSLFARLGALQGGKRFDFATVASEVLGDKDITLAGIAEKAGFIQDSTLHRRFVAALREDKMGDRLKEWGQLKDKLRNTTDKKEQEEIAKRMAVIQTDYEKMQRDFIKENLSSEHFTEIINALNIDDKTREKILKAKKEGGTEAVHKVLDEISGKGLGLKSKDIRGPEEVKVDPQTEAVKEEMMRKYAGKGVKDKAEEGKGGGSVTVEHKWGGSAKVNILINGEHKATVELPNPESKTISSDEERAKSANKQESIEVSAGPAVKG